MSSSLVTATPMFSFAGMCFDVGTQVDMQVDKELMCVDDDGAPVESTGSPTDDVMTDALATKADCLKLCASGGAAMEAFCRAIPDPRIKLACFAARLALPLCTAFCAKYY